MAIANTFSSIELEIPDQRWTRPVYTIQPAGSLLSWSRSSDVGTMIYRHTALRLPLPLPQILKQILQLFCSSCY